MTRQYSRFSGGVPLSASASPAPESSLRYSRDQSDTPAADQEAATQASANWMTTEAPAPKVLWVFLISIIIPVEFVVGSLLITPARLLLICLFPLLFLRWISGQYGGIKLMDLCIFGYSTWTVLALMSNHGLAAIEFTGITVIETFAAYLLGRALVRNARQFSDVGTYLKYSLIFIMPFVVVESFLGRPIYLDIFDIIGRTYPWMSADPSYGRRLGLLRAQGGFPHPILLGVFAATAFPFLYFSLDHNTGKPGGLKRAWPAFPITFLSLSSGAFLSLLLSGGLTIWNAMFRRIRGHWLIIFGFCVAFFVAIDLLSDRTPFEVFITYAAFSAHNGYIRINIFLYGMDNVWANPWFGLGLNDWARPFWMHAASVDNYWLLTAMRYGIPAFLLMVSTWLVGIIGTAQLKLHSPRAQAARRAWVISLVATTTSLVTVHMWGTHYMFMLFVLGMGAWLGDFAKSPENVPDHPDNAAPAAKGRQRR